VVITERRVSWVLRVEEDLLVIMDLPDGEREGEEREYFRSRDVRMELDLERMESASALHLLVDDAGLPWSTWATPAVSTVMEGSFTLVGEGDLEEEEEGKRLG
jgi:hypothetical protein